MISRPNFLNKLLKDINVLSTDSARCKELYKVANEQYGLAISLVFEIITFKKPLECYDENIIFSICSLVNNNLLYEYYTEDQIKKYNSFRYDKISNIFPLRIKLTKVNYDQWIGAISVKQLMKFKENHLINYNKITQRRLKTVNSPGFEYQASHISPVAIKKIKENLQTSRFIPNTITLNMFEADFYYDENEGELVINNIMHFDIIDGYHRYLALSQICEFEPDFDYPLEIRIVNFNVSKAQQFIFQEDQKTKIGVLNSRIYNQYFASNKICDEINANPASCFYGKINKFSSSNIDYAIFSFLINSFLLEDEEDSNYKNILNDIMQKINILASAYPDISTKSFKNKDLFALVIAIQKSNKNNIVKKYKEINERFETVKDDLFVIKVGIRRELRLIMSDF